MRLFEPYQSPRVFMLPPGCDFAKEFTKGLISRFASILPEESAKSEIYLNTGRVRTGIIKTFTAQGAYLLPQLRLVSELANDLRFFDISPQTPTLKRRLELFQAVSKLLENDERFAAKTSAFDLADSLAVLMDEMHSEGVSPDELRELDVSQHSAHWAQSLKFIDIISQFWKRTDVPDKQTRQRLVVEKLVTEWQKTPPFYPIIVAGSTGSRGATRLLMETVAKLPQGAVVLPCFDEHLPPEVWSEKNGASMSEDHPQFRFKTFLDSLNIQPSNVLPWRPEAATNYNRNQLVSLALRPAPVTEQWLTEGPNLENVDVATNNIDLIEAPHPRAEANAVAYRLRMAAEYGIKASFVTPDQKLARQVKAALSRWNIQAQDGIKWPLNKTNPGKLLLLVSVMIGGHPDNVTLISLLRQSMVHTANQRSEHNKCVDILEQNIRRNKLNLDLTSLINHLSLTNKNNQFIVQWCCWLTEILQELVIDESTCLSSMVTNHFRIANNLIAGSCPNDQQPDDLWNTLGGTEILNLIREMQREGETSGILDTHSYQHLFASLMAQNSVVRSSSNEFMGIAIWDTLDARMQSPDLIIAGGLNEGIWPTTAPVDPWLNRDLRRQANLLMPERLTGLLAHDFQQAISVENVILSRSVRHANEPAVPSRWLIRLTTLLEGLGDNGRLALQAMRNRGNQTLKLAQAMERPRKQIARALRPNPKPPVAARPVKLSVTNIKTLLTDPYEIYARHILNLTEIDPLKPANYAATRGIIIHQILKNFIETTLAEPNKCTAEELMRQANSIVHKFPVATYLKRLWITHLAGISDAFIEQEIKRRKTGKPIALEERGEITLPELNFKLTVIADRIDNQIDGSLSLYDYKTGILPGPTEIGRRDKQIPLTAKVLNLGGFKKIPAAEIQTATYIGVGKNFSMKSVNINIIEQNWNDFLKLLVYYQQPENGYLSRLNKYQYQYGQAYDHLARYGEWDETDQQKSAGTDT